MASSSRKIETENAPKAIGPYSQAIHVSMKEAALLFVSGQLPIDPRTGALVEGGIQAATRQVLDNIEAILQAAHSSFEKVVRVEIFLKDLNDFPVVNEEYKKRFTSMTFPARQTIQVAKLPLDAPIEISCTATCPSE